ncbi:hypothetical protein ACWD0J_35570 [Streptomyces sp. NPDC003011]
MNAAAPLATTDVVDAELVDAQDALAPALPDADVDINDVLTDEAVEDLANSGRERTRGTYQERFKAFATWCAARGRTPGPPTTESNLVSYISHLKRAGVDFGTIRLTIAAVVHMNARAGHTNWPPTDKAKAIYADARHEQREAGRSPKSAPPLDMERRLQILEACPDDLAGLRDRVIAHLGYYCRGRRSDLAKFRIASLEEVSDSLLIVRKWTSKNDKTDEGREYEIDDEEAIHDILTWRAFLRGRGEADPLKPLLRRIDQWGNLGPISGKGWGMTPHAINEATKRMAQRADLDVKDTATSHGWRAGVPADLGRLGYTADDIKHITGDWRSTDQVEKYRKVGRRRAGLTTDQSRRAHAITELQTLKPGAAPAGSQASHAPSQQGSDQGRFAQGVDHQRHVGGVHIPDEALAQVDLEDTG